MKIYLDEGPQRQIIFSFQEKKVSFQQTQTNIWHKLSLTYQASNFSLFLNGSLIETWISPFTPDIRNSKKINFYDEPIIIMQDLRLFDRALSEIEIKTYQRYQKMDFESIIFQWELYSQIFEEVTKTNFFTIKKPKFEDPSLLFCQPYRYLNTMSQSCNGNNIKSILIR